MLHDPPRWTFERDHLGMRGLVGVEIVEPLAGEQAHRSVDGVLVSDHDRGRGGGGTNLFDCGSGPCCECGEGLGGVRDRPWVLEVGLELAGERVRHGLPRNAPPADEEAPLGEAGMHPHREAVRGGDDLCGSQGPLQWR